MKADTGLGDVGAHDRRACATKASAAVLVVLVLVLGLRVVVPAGAAADPGRAVGHHAPHRVHLVDDGLLDQRHRSHRRAQQDAVAVCDLIGEIDKPLLGVDLGQQRHVLAVVEHEPPEVLAVKVVQRALVGHLVLAGDDLPDVV